MQTLPTTFRDHGFDYTQLARDGDVALLKQSKPGMKTVAFEVILVQTERARTFPSGKHYPEREAMPYPSDWGKKAWTFLNLELAEVRFWLLVTIRNVFPTRTEYSSPEMGKG